MKPNLAKTVGHLISESLNQTNKRPRLLILDQIQFDLFSDVGNLIDLTTVPGPQYLVTIKSFNRFA